MGLFLKHFPNSLQKCSIIGMIHVRATPGSPMNSHTVQQLVDIACEEARTYAKHQVDGICVENMFDIPYLKPSQVGPELVATMTRVCSEVRKTCRLPCGVQILAGLNKEALAVALATNLQFIRAEGFVFSHVADEGFTDSCAAELTRYRKQIDASEVAILTDIKKKHCSHAITADVDVVHTAKAANFFLSDGVIVTGKETGDSADLNEVKQIQDSIPHLPVIIGSGVTEQNLQQCLESGAHAAIIGSYFKIEGEWYNEICEKRLGNFMDRYRELTA